MSLRLFQFVQFFKIHSFIRILNWDISFCFIIFNLFKKLNHFSNLNKHYSFNQTGFLILPDGF